jgi:hypothetical protein
MAGIAKRLALVCATLLTVGAGAAYATGTLGSLIGADGTISACVQKASGDVKIVAPGRRCGGHDQVALQWNEQGPKGDRGDTGAPGADGRSIVATALDVSSSRCNGAGGYSLAYSDGTPIGDLCNGAAGPKGDGAGIAGSACSVNGTAGTAQESVDPWGRISFTCIPDSSAGTGGDGGGGGTGTGDQCPSTLPAYAHATTGCDPATGDLSLQCDPGFGDVDGDITTGCEDDLNTDVLNCGRVGNDVTNEFMHATAGCVQGTAVLLACDRGWVDEDGIAVNGCELEQDPTDPNGASTP